MMAEQWPVKTIEELCELRTGGTPSRSVEEYFEDGEILWLVSADIHKKTITDCDNRITELGMEKSSAKPLPVDSVLIALNGQGKTRGTVAMLKVPATCNQSIACMTPKNRSELDYQFLYYFLDGSYQKLRGITGHKDRRGLNLRILRIIEIPVPPLDEQRRIVSIFDEAFENISRSVINSENRITSVEELIETTLQLVFHQESLDWEKIPFEESIVKVKSTPKIKRRDYKETGPYPIISQEADYINGYWDTESDLLTIENPVVVFGDHTKTLKYIDFDFVRGADGLKVFQPREFILPKFFYHHLRSVRLETLGYARHYRLLKQVEIRYPDIERQHQIASMFDELDEQALLLKKLYEKELQSLDELKLSIFQEAFSGRLTGGIAA